MAESAPIASRLAAALGAVVVDLGIRDDPGATVQEVRELIAEPVALFQRHAAWPSLLTDSGVPVEVSLRVGGAGGPALRCVADVTDHGASFADNWSRYVENAHRVAADAATVDEVWDLCRLHLDGVPPGFRSRIIHGLGYARQGWRRGSLYFRTGWLPPEELSTRLPAVAAVLAEVSRVRRSPVGGEVEVMGYDFVPQQPVRAKAYCWTPPLGDAAFEDLVGSHPDLEPARELFERFRAGVDQADSHALLLQTSAESPGVQQRLFFLGHAWRWDVPDRRDELLSVLGDRVGIETGALVRLEEAAARYGVPLKLAMVAAGAEDGGPSVTFYLWPSARFDSATRARPGRRAPLRAAETVLARAVEYVLGARSADGSWQDYRADGFADDDGAPLPGATDAFVTAYVASALAVDGALKRDLDATFRWLADHHRGGCGWDCDGVLDIDVETTALAVVAFARVGSGLPAEVDAALGSANGEAPADVAAAILSALAEAFPEKIRLLVPAADDVVARQRPDGGWSSVRWDDDLVATWRATRALRAYVRTDFARSRVGESRRNAAAYALGRSSAFVSALPVPPEAVRLALWLGAWASGPAHVAEPRVARAVASLQDLQRPDGRLLGRPNRRASADASGKAYIDRRCIITTATTVDALHEVIARLSA